MAYLMAYMAFGNPDVMAVPGGLPGMMPRGGIFPYLLREAADSERQRVLDRAEQNEERPEIFPVLLCRACGHIITSLDQRIEVAGSHRHTFFNPAGIVFELGCFAKAPGCSLLGDASSEFSWFAGYVWRIALCARCGIHLGWLFQAAEISFYGLVLSNLEIGQKQL